MKMSSKSTSKSHYFHWTLSYDSVCDRMMNTLLGDDHTGAGDVGPTPVADLD